MEEEKAVPCRAYHHRLAKLLTGTALVLKQLLTTVWGLSFGDNATPIMWRKIHNVFAETPVEETLLFHNDDLVGFFNSIPQERLIAMVEALLREFQTKHPAAFVMVDAHGSTKTFAVHLGFSKQSSHANFKRFWLEHLVALVQFLSNVAGLPQWAYIQTNSWNVHGKPN